MWGTGDGWLGCHLRGGREAWRPSHHLQGVRVWGEGQCEPCLNSLASTSLTFCQTQSLWPLVWVGLGEGRALDWTQGPRHALCSVTPDEESPLLTHIPSSAQTILYLTGGPTSFRILSPELIPVLMRCIFWTSVCDTRMTPVGFLLLILLQPSRLWKSFWFFHFSYLSASESGVSTFWVFTQVMYKVRRKHGKNWVCGPLPETSAILLSTQVRFIINR